MMSPIKYRIKVQSVFLAIREKKNMAELQFCHNFVQKEASALTSSSRVLS